ncbi:MAG: hypothetical protein SGPRY_012999, partial [Prymnesium sp.]
MLALAIQCEALAVRKNPCEPSGHAMAMRMDAERWSEAERNELSAHEHNGSWELCDLSEVPTDVNITRPVWVYK